MRLVRDVAPVEGLPYLARLGFDPDDAGRLTVASDRAEQTGTYVEAASGESRLLHEGEHIPEGVWISQREIDDLKPHGGVEASPDGHGFGEGFGTQGEQFGGDRSYPEEDAGGTRRVPHGEMAEDVDPFVNNPTG
jgi:hypothetical protein